MHSYRNEEHPFATDAEYADGGEYSAADDPLNGSGFMIWREGAKYQVREGDTVLCTCEDYYDALAAANRAILNRAFNQ